MGERKRWLYAAVSAAALIFLGLIYAWSVFVVPLEAEFGWTRPQTSLTFSISMAFFCLGGLAGGALSQKVSPRMLLFGCGLFIAAGFALLSISHTLPSLYLFYGVMAGFGVGIGYNTLMSIVVGWFPDHTGLLSGLLLMGFGFGGSILSSAFNAGITAVGWRNTFRISGAALFAVICLTACLLRPPAPHKEGSSRESIAPKEMLRSRAFRGYYIWTILIGAAGLALIGNAVPFVSSFIGGSAEAVTIAGLLSIANGVGRLIFGFALDRFGITRSMWAISMGFLLGTALLTAAAAAKSMYLLIPAFCLVGFFYGAVTPTNSAYVLGAFGPEHYSANFSLAVTNLLFAAFLGPAVSGALQRGGSYFTTAAFMMVLAAAALPMVRRAVSACRKPGDPLKSK